jgi:hypothetical protein
VQNGKSKTADPGACLIPSNNAINSGDIGGDCMTGVASQLISTPLSTTKQKAAAAQLVRQREPSARFHPATISGQDKITITARICGKRSPQRLATRK